MLAVLWLVAGAARREVRATGLAGDVAQGGAYWQDWLAGRATRAAAASGRGWAVLPGSQSLVGIGWQGADWLPWVSLPGGTERRDLEPQSLQVHFLCKDGVKFDVYHKKFESSSELISHPKLSRPNRTATEKRDAGPPVKEIANDAVSVVFEDERGSGTPGHLLDMKGSGKPRASIDGPGGGSNANAFNGRCAQLEVTVTQNLFKNEEQVAAEIEQARQVLVSKGYSDEDIASCKGQYASYYTMLYVQVSDYASVMASMGLDPTEEAIKTMLKGGLKQAGDFDDVARYHKATLLEGSAISRRDVRATAVVGSGVATNVVVPLQGQEAQTLALAFTQGPECSGEPGLRCAAGKRGLVLLTGHLSPGLDPQISWATRYDWNAAGFHGRRMVLYFEK